MQADGPPIEIMNVHLTADFNHDDEDQDLVIMNMYPEGTQNRVPGFSQFQIPPHRVLMHQQLVCFAVPVIGRKGHPWTGRLILIDQFQRRYKTGKATYRWTGPPS